MTRPLRNISASVEKRLLNLSRQSGEDFQYVLMRYGLERLMYRLSRSVYAKEFVVKGALLLRVWTGEQYRPTKDLDLLAILDKSPEELDQIFRDICTLTVEDDGLVFRSETIRVRQIREDNVYGGMPPSGGAALYCQLNYQLVCQSSSFSTPANYRNGTPSFAGAD